MKISKMHSGHLCLELTDLIDWNSFPSYANSLIRSLGLRLLEKYDAPDTRIWKIASKRAELRLVFDDYPLLVTIESSDILGDAQVQEIYRALCSANK